MKKMAFLGCLFLFWAMAVFAQEQVEGPVWDVGDKWVFTQGKIEVIGADKSSYALNFSKDTCIIENRGFETIIFGKSTLHRIYFLREEKREKYTEGLRKILDFPFRIGKQWKDNYAARPIVGPNKNQAILDYYEQYKILGWEEATVKAGKFRALKIETIRGHDPIPHRWIPGIEYKNHYWYTPEVKYFIKYEADPAQLKEYPGEVVNWELTSFQLKK